MVKFNISEQEDLKTFRNGVFCILEFSWLSDNILGFMSKQKSLFFFCSYVLERCHIWLQWGWGVQSRSWTELLFRGGSVHPLQTQSCPAWSLERTVLYTKKHSRSTRYLDSIDFTWQHHISQSLYFSCKKCSNRIMFTNY